MKNTYALYIDYLSGKGPAGGYKYKMMKAENLLDAIAEADAELNEEEMYLIRIMEKVGKAVKCPEWECKVEEFHAVLCNRRHGWHINDEKHYEGEHWAHRYFRNETATLGGYEFFECFDKK